MEDAAKLLAKCKNGKHQLEIIFRVSDSWQPGISSVVRWCKVCGSIVVDKDVDGRTAHGKVMKMKSPEITKKLASN